jgi:hypothetical protein
MPLLCTWWHTALHSKRFAARTLYKTLRQSVAPKCSQHITMVLMHCSQLCVQPCYCTCRLAAGLHTSLGATDPPTPSPAKHPT